MVTGTYLGVDLGASSGRVMAAWQDEAGRIALEEVRRFENNPVRCGESLVWDFEGLMTEILAGLKDGISRAQAAGREVVNIGVDSWAVDFGLVDKDGKLVGPVYHYRDSRTEGHMDKVFERVQKAEVFQHSGIQFLPFNTLYQLSALKEAHPEWLEQARHFMMIADLVAWRLTGVATCEYTNATTTQMFDPRKGDWSDTLIGNLALPRDIFQPPILPGQKIGNLTDELAKKWSAPNVKVVSVATHDTASAVAAVPASHKGFAYLSSGTWSLLGTEVNAPNLMDAMTEENFTNEGGVEATFRLLKNIMGLWILQESRRNWAEQGKTYGWPELEKMAAGSSYESTFDVDDARFLAPPNMLEAITAWYKEQGIEAPQSDADIARSVLLSLAKCYAVTLKKLELLSGTQYEELHVVGGGAQNALLCQLTANAIGRPVLAGPIEATVLGNVGVQMIADDKFKNIEDLRACIRESFPVTEYKPAAQ